MMEQEQVDALNGPAEDKKEWGVIVDADNRLLRSAVNPRYDEYPFEFMMPEHNCAIGTEGVVL